MNERAEIEDFLGIAGVIVVIICGFFGVSYLFGNVTANQLVVGISNGKITSAQLNEVSVSRLNSWGDSTGNGYYSIVVSAGNDTLKRADKAAAGMQVYYIKKFVNCLNVSLFDSNYAINALDKREVCKNG